ncbi:MAG: NosD domain-containing protein [Candidatus Bathyarchaeia archaeon]
MKLRKILVAVVLVVLLVVSFFVALDNLRVPAKQTAGSSEPFFVGIETGWNSPVSDCKALIDKVKNYTNLFIIASPLILSNEALLNETCDYAYNAGMYFMPAYYQDIYNGTSIGYTPSAWFTTAKERYGDKLLGIYFYDEPAGSQLDESINLTSNNAFNATTAPNSYLDYANWFFRIWTMGNGVPVVANLTHSLGSSLFTSDYALYWFDYELGYDTVLAQFGWNNSRPLQIALARGAATVQNKTWGAIITWTYNQLPYLESGPQMYNNMVLAYDSGASYIAVYDSTQNYTGTTLTPDRYDALQNFWNYVQHNPDKHGNLKADTAVVLPQDYGFGFRNPDDSVWQYHQADNWTQKMYSDVTNLINQYKSSIDIVYSDPQFQSSIQSKYSEILYWPKDFETNNNYSVIDLNNGLGYNSIQEAISSFATYEGDTILVKPGTYQENIVITKPVSLISQNKNPTIIDGAKNGTVLSIACDNVTVTGFTLQNGGNFSTGTGEGILLHNAHNCSLIGNTVTNSYNGIVLNDSFNNVFRNNTMSDNKFNFGVSASNITNYINNVDTSNSVNGKPIYYWVNKSNMTVPSNAGFIALINCTDVTVQNLNLSDNYEGLLLAYVKNSTVTNNTINNNYEGIALDNSSGNTLKGNNVNNNVYNIISANCSAK